MATQAEVREHNQAVADLVDLALQELREFWRSLGVDDPREIARLVREFTPELANAAALGTSTLTADWYEDLRAEAAVASAFTAIALDGPDVDDVQDQLGYVLAPLFAGVVSPEAAPAETFDRLALLIEGVVTSADRQTVEANVATDRGRPMYARHASANACTFCRMLATRGAEYTSRQAATRVVLERKRNKRKLGEKYHDFCRCTAVPVWGSKTYEEAPYVADWREAYYEAVDELGGATDTKAILAHMRESMSLRH